MNDDPVIDVPLRYAAPILLIYFPTEDPTLPP
jgi:hypothetical protein